MMKYKGRRESNAAICCLNWTVRFASAVAAVAAVAAAVWPTQSRLLAR